jgi:hypothetical protein
MKNDVIIAGPGGNYTAFVIAPTELSKRMALDKKLRCEDPRIEQVCFVTRDAIGWHGDMTGGEFCGAAALSLGFLIMEWENSSTARFNFSGAPQPISVNKNYGQVSSTLFPNITCHIQTLEKDITCVRLPGIVHLVTYNPRPEISISEYFKKLIARYALANEPAVGLMRVQDNGGSPAIDPWVWVRDINSLINETACISGAAAVGLIIHQQKNQVDTTIKIRQPCSTITKLHYRANSSNNTVSVTVTSKIMRAQTLMKTG